MMEAADKSGLVIAVNGENIGGCAMNEQEYAMPYQTTDLIPQSGEERLQLSISTASIDNAIRRQQSLIDRAIDDGFLTTKTVRPGMSWRSTRREVRQPLQYNEIKLKRFCGFVGAYRRTKLDGRSARARMTTWSLPQVKTS